MRLIVKQKRPVNLDLATLKFPAMAIASILHRISGLVIFLFFPFILYLLSISLHSPNGLSAFHEVMTCVYSKVLLWGFLSAFIYHSIAGIRHLVMDFGFGETVHAGRISAIFVVFLGVVMTLLMGMWIW